MKTFIIKPKKLIFKTKVRLACTSCKRYGFKATCPPNVESIDYYKKALKTYKHCVICYDEFKLENDNWGNSGMKSSLAIHKYLLKRRDELVKTGRYFYAIFGAGSCKLCEQCSFPCRNPKDSLIPLEGTGIDVVATLKGRINIEFPVTDTFYRIGAIFYG